MESVSASFKKAIKSDTREIKGYVEVIYKNINMDDYTMAIAPTKIRFSLDNEIVDSNRKTKNYASLEENYTLLDGSFILPNYNLKGDNAGYISEDIFQNIATTILKISNENNPILSPGITIYFKNNIAQKFNITITKSDNTILEINEIDNQKEIYQYIFEEDISIKSLQLDIIQMEYSNRRIRISEIDLGISQIYEGQDLVSFNIDEEIDLLLTSTPINDCKINLNNYDNSFDPINPIGLVKYLTDECIIKPFVGCLTEDNGVEYLCVGNYYLKDWSADIDGNATLNGQNILGKITDYEVPYSSNMVSQNLSIVNLANLLKEQYGLTLYGSVVQSANPCHLEDTNLINFLRAFASIQQNDEKKVKLYIDRKNNIRMYSLNKDVVETIPQTQLLEKVKSEITNKIKKVEINYLMGVNASEQTQNDTIINQNIELSNTEQYVWIKNSKFILPNDFSYSFSYSSSDGAKASLISLGRKISCFKLTGKKGDNINLQVSGTSLNNATWDLSTSYTNNEIEIGDVISLDFRNYLYLNEKALFTIAKALSTESKSIKINANYIGDPSLVPGDTVLIETKYGYKKIIITKQSLTFDGGLSGTIEGVGD